VRYGKLSSHEWEVPELLWAMEMHGDLPPTRIIAMGVDPAELHLDRLAMGLSPAIEVRLPALELVLLAELADAGILLEPRTRPIGVPDADDLVTAGREPHHA
jgi:Ni,Fe-hydrogenase maturation factor